MNYVEHKQQVKGVPFPGRVNLLYFHHILCCQFCNMTHLILIMMTDNMNEHGSRIYHTTSFDKYDIGLHSNMSLLENI